MTYFQLLSFSLLDALSVIYERCIINKLKIYRVKDIMLVLERNHDPIFNWHLNFTFGVELLYDLAYYSLQHLLFSQMQVVLKSNFDDLDITARNISI